MPFVTLKDGYEGGVIPLPFGEGEATEIRMIAYEPGTPFEIPEDAVSRFEKDEKFLLRKTDTTPAKDALKASVAIKEGDA